MSFNPFPPAYQLFFCTVEPALTIGGVLYSVLAPLKYHQELIPTSVASTPLDVHPASLMAIRQLGSCFFLLALLATFFLRTVHNSLATQPILLERLIASYLWCLAVADVTHIVFTFFDLGLAGTLDFANWNTLVWGNCGITSVLFLVRMLWFQGVGRGVGLVVKAKK